ncbi:MAG: glycoside hydrolase family 97 protein [Bacteroides sp.]|nr:glycoside hydrolase family 97 protein [Bacteroides sp.]
MKYNYYIPLLMLLIAVSGCNTSPKESVSSPDRQIKVKVGLQDGRLYYTVAKENQTILDRSFLGFELQGSSLKDNFRITNIRHSSFYEQWDQPWGEETTVENNYNEMIVDLQETTHSARRLSVAFRVFNDGFGFRYLFPEQENLKEFVIMDELTEFNLIQDHQTWGLSYNTKFYEGLYEKQNISQLDTVCTPLTMETAGGLYLTIHEANLTDYAAMNLTPQEGSTRLGVYLTPWSTGEKVFTQAPGATPWRTMIIAENPGDLILSRLMLNLNEPSKIEDTSWIKPGRYIGIWWGMHMKKHTWEMGPKHGATTKNTKQYMDFAAKHGFSGVLVEGWNPGWEKWCNYSFTESYPDFDIEEVTRYGREKGVALIGHHETGGEVARYEEQLEDAFAYYQKHGVHVVKTGYVGGILDKKERHSSQFGVRHYRKVIETAARYQIMIDNHEPVMPTGLQRTWPNLMTQEGVRGQEWDAWDVDGGNPPVHTTVIPFTRGLAGPMDFTPVTFKFENPVLPQTRVQTTIAKQLALFVVLYSPLQMASDMIENYENRPEFEFITSCPVNWSATTVPEAKIGEYVTIARKDRDSEAWFIGSITGEHPREAQIDLSFLDDDRSYTATIYRDGKDADWKSNPYPVEIEERTVDSGTVLVIHQASGGGTAIRITPNP